MQKRLTSSTTRLSKPVTERQGRPLGDIHQQHIGFGLDHNLEIGQGGGE